MSTMPPPPAPKKTNVVLWIIVGVFGFFLFVGLLFMIAGYFFIQKVKQAGVDPDLMRRNPAMAVTKMIAAVNPNVEVISVDDAKGVIVVRNKTDGKVYRMNFEDVKQGRIVMQEEGKAPVTVDTKGGSGSLEIKTPEGTTKIGGGVTHPDWIPDYPGATNEGAYSVAGGEGDSGSYSFKTKDPVDKVISFYDDQFTKANLKVQRNSMNQNGKVVNGVVNAEDEGKKRNAIVTVSSDDQGVATVGVTFQAKK
jgi:hypothetical protein